MLSRSINKLPRNDLWVSINIIILRQLIYSVTVLLLLLLFILEINFLNDYNLKKYFQDFVQI